jgi:16S rRNA (guanine527-N7)-methyltransferase
MDIIEKYFPSLSSAQLTHYSKLHALYRDWNTKINVISRKDIDFLYTRHVLHSLSIAKFIRFLPGSDILDLGTGGGFPGIPLAIMFPESNFLLVDSIGKKIKVVKSITSSLGLKNLVARQIRAENISNKYDFILSRAVANLPTIIGWVGNRIKENSKHPIPNGIIALKGGDLKDELDIQYKISVQSISKYFKEPFFETKKIVHISLP